MSAEAAAELGPAEGIPVSYRAGDQPNNALSLNVFNPGEIASTAGTSGVVYGVLGEVNYDLKSRVNTFAHVNHTNDRTRLGVLLCINGTGILNSWSKRTVAPEGIGYAEMNDVADQAPIGAAGVSVIPFGNGAERVLQNKGSQLLDPRRELPYPQQIASASRRSGGHRVLIHVWHGDHGADGHADQQDPRRTRQHVPQPAFPQHSCRSQRSHNRAL